ncbi:CapA family protein [Sphingobacterium sp. LRF_L2]|uniref:CapA family protein n=1 Tax=Sphingobacterium sp. LRF_L2 TaxID=3369421 RepID=UPI003F6384A5
MHHKLLFVGDVVAQSKPEFSNELKELFKQQHFCCCNVEAPLSGVGYPQQKTGPLLNQNKEAGKWLKNLGFNLFSMANNHINDYGTDAMLSTSEAFGSDDCFGVGDENKAYSMLVREVEGIRYGFLSYGENGFGALNGDREYGYAWVNHSQVDSKIRDYRKQVDVLIVQVHAGVEMIDVPIPEWRKRYRELVDCGADLIIGHHPHVLQGVEIYKSKYIVYSLGNFYFDGILNSREWNLGGILQLQVDRGNIIELKLSVVIKDENKLILKTDIESVEILDTLNRKLVDERQYVKYVDEIAEEQWKQHHIHYYAKPFNGIGKFTLRSLVKHFKRLVFNRSIDYRMLWHNMEIESNFWVVRRAIQKFNREKI